MEASATNPTCPRCGYDLSGHMASWESSCPVKGQCSECGLNFEWATVFRPEVTENPRYIEYARWRRVPLATIRTLAWLILPWVFWRHVALSRNVRLARLSLWLAGLLVGAHVLNSLLVVVARFETHWASESQWDPNYRLPWDRFGDWLFEALIHPFFRPFAQSHEFNWAGLSPAVWALGTATILFPVVFLALRQTRSRFRVSVNHILRASLLASSWLFIPLLVRFGVTAQVMLDPGSHTMTMSAAPIGDGFTYYYWPLYFVLALAWMSTWWYFAIARGWSFARPTLHFALIWVIVAIVAVLALGLRDPKLPYFLMRPDTWLEPFDAWRPPYDFAYRYHSEWTAYFR